MMPTVDRELNAKKRRLDHLAGELLDLDKKDLELEASGIAFDLLGESPIRLCVTGAAGSGKTTASAVIGERLNLPVFDFDEYVPGGYHEDGKIYRKRLIDGMSNLFDALPVKRGWIVEHVEACNEDMVKAFRPTFCLLICPPTDRLLQVARVRSSLSADDPLCRELRALQSAEYAKMQFDAVPGDTIKETAGWRLKRVVI
jgi:hypothetical protein